LKAPNHWLFRYFAHLGLLGFLAAAVVYLSAQDLQHPASGYLEARLKSGLDAGHAKVGERFQAEVVSQWQTGDCVLLKETRIYGTIVSATRHSKSSPESTLGLLIESAECQDHPGTRLGLHILEIILPDSSRDSLNNALPRDSHNNGSIVAGTGASAMKNNDPAADQENLPIRVGSVIGSDGARLEIAEGSHFADVLHSDKRNVSLLTGTRLVLGTKEMIPDDQQLHLQPASKQP
jgi:hypothetical protein